MKVRYKILFPVLLLALYCGSSKNLIHERMKMNPTVEVVFIPSGVTHNRIGHNKNNIEFDSEYSSVADVVAEAWQAEYSAANVTVNKKPDLDKGADYKAGKPAGFKLENFESDIIVLVYGHINYFSEEETLTDDEGKNKKVYELYLMAEMYLEIYDRNEEECFNFLFQSIQDFRYWIFRHNC